MPRLQELHPDQQAVLQLLLRRQMPFADLAAGLALSVEQVRERALDAVDGLAPDDIDGLTLADRDRIAEYLLGQQDGAEQEATRALLSTQAPAREWATLVRRELTPLAAGALPPVPDGTSPPASSAHADEPEGITAAFAALDAPTRPRTGRSLPTFSPTRIAAAAAGALVVVVLLLWVAGVFGGDSSSPPATAATTTSTAAAAAASGDNAAALAMVSALSRQINFDPPEGASGSFAQAKGVGAPQAVQGVPGVVFQGEGFPAMSSKRVYAVWLDGNGKKPVRLGWFSDGKNGTTATIDKNGKIEQAFFPFSQAGADGKAQLVDPRGYATMRITRESSAGTKPGPTIVSGSLH